MMPNTADPESLAVGLLFAALVFLVGSVDMARDATNYRAAGLDRGAEKARRFSWLMVVAAAGALVYPAHHWLL